MDDKLNFLRGALMKIPPHTITYLAYPDTGGCDAWGEVECELTLTVPQILSLVFSRLDDPKLFEDFPQEPIPENDIYAEAFEGCFPDARVSICSLPYDLEDVAELYDEELLNDDDDDDDDDDEEIYDDDEEESFIGRMQELADEEYTFEASICDEDVEVEVYLTGDEARGLVLSELGITMDNIDYTDFTLADVEKRVDPEEVLPSVSENWEDAVIDDEYLWALENLIKEYLDDALTEEEVLDRLDDLAEYN